MLDKCMHCPPYPSPRRRTSWRPQAPLGAVSTARPSLTAHPDSPPLTYPCSVSSGSSPSGRARGRSHVLEISYAVFCLKKKKSLHIGLAEITDVCVANA